MQKLVVDKIEALTDRIRLLTLVADAGTELGAYKAGAHIDINLGEVGTRSYSLVDFARPTIVSSGIVIFAFR